MIDLYTNILPNVGKGPRDKTAFLAMAKSLMNQGVTAVVAAPLYESEGADSSSILMHIAAANESLQHSFIPLTILPGQKATIHHRLVQAYEQNAVVTINQTTKYMLLQLSTEYTISATEQIFYQLQLKGIVPIVSEPERNAVFLEKPDHLYELVRKGAIVQLSAGSLTGQNGRKEKKAALSFINNGLAHVIASGVCGDTYEQYALPKAYDMLSKQFGTQTLYKFMENADYVVEGRAIFKEQPERIKKGKILGIF
ncbi:CpsB/CapC family capsule biosynthesis tyrosine phosphatase [Priestia megaterium]|uniref:tyrosine-protein phosphatase n=1 Tax=Priestia megaterium TaxID=1404 RepID=UPI000BF4E9B3|nr:CpsB/CapC family capsule biosynthesis tyrosine phosphatase [Priestia megaterium]PFQ85553.1 tyrosine protein phosphatase [Priestia megaterium]